MKKSTKLLFASVVVFFILSIASAKCSVYRTEKAISNIGEVAYTDECKEKIDRAVFYYNSLDPKLVLEEKITNTAEFDQKKIEYARLAIKAAKVADARKTVEEYSNTDVENYVKAAREVVTNYLKEDQYMSIENYADLVALESEYASSGGGGATEEVSIPMC